MRLMELIQPVQEIETSPQGEFPRDDWMRDILQFNRSSIHNAKFWNRSENIRYFVKDKEYIYTTDGYEITGYMRLHQRPVGAQIEIVYVPKEWRGAGIGGALYDIALAEFGTLISDDTQTPSGQRMWVYLHGKPGVHVTAVLRIHPEFLIPKLVRELDKLGATLNTINRRDGQYEYYIPVDTEDRMRKLKTNSRLLKLYNNNDYGLLLIARKGRGKTRAAE